MSAGGAGAAYAPGVAVRQNPRAERHAHVRGKAYPATVSTSENPTTNTP